MDDYEQVCAKFALEENAHAVRADWLFSRALLSQAVAFAFAAMGAARVLGAAVRLRDQFSFLFRSTLPQVIIAAISRHRPCKKSAHCFGPFSATRAWLCASE